MICRQCGVDVRDSSRICPLCRCVLDSDEGALDKYPDIGAKQYSFKLATRIYLFAAIVLESVLVYLNYRYFSGTFWSVVPGVVLAYIYLTLAYTISNTRAGYRMKILVGAASAVILMLVADRALGGLGWSVSYALPIVLLAVDAALLILMVCNRKSWQSYIIFELEMVLISFVPAALGRAGYVHAPWLSYLAFAASAFLFLGTFIIGGKRARVELKRRFHI